MNDSRSLRLVMVFALLLALACFISAPVFSAEDPWDADNGDGGGGDGNNSDSTDTSGVTDYEERFVQGGSDWFSWLLFEMSFGIATFFFEDNGLTNSSGTSQRKAVSNGRSASSRANNAMR